LEAAHECLVDAHHGARVVEFAAIVWRREECYQLPVAEELIAVLDDLVRSANQVDLILVSKLADDVLSKGEADPSVVIAPVCDLLVRVGPK